MNPRKIKTNPDGRNSELEIHGWFNGTQTYLWLGKDGICIGTIGGQKLYRLAKAIVKQFEEERIK